MSDKQLAVIVIDEDDTEFAIGPFPTAVDAAIFALDNLSLDENTDLVIRFLKDPQDFV